MKSTAVKMLEELVSRPEGSWTPVEGALAVARLDRSRVDEKSARETLQRLAGDVRARLGDATHPRFVAGCVSRVLYDEFSLRCESSGLEPSHCMLDVALAIGVASPELTALIYIEVARAAGFRFSPVGLPGRLLLRRDLAGQPFLFDPTRRGVPVGLDECKQIVVDASGGETEFSDGFLRPITSSQLLARVVARLKEVLWQANSFEPALGAVDLMLAIRPDDPREIRDRGRLLFLLGRLGDAIRAFESYLVHNPRGEDADVVRMLIQEARAGLPPSARS